MHNMCIQVLQNRFQVGSLEVVLVYPIKNPIKLRSSLCPVQSQLYQNMTFILGLSVGQR